MTETSAAPPVMSPSALAGMSASHQLMFFTVAAPVARCLWALAKLGVADRLADGPQPIGKLSAAVGADPDALHRILRATATFGIFTLLPDGRVGLTPAAEHLRATHPVSLRDAVLLHGEQLHTRPYEEILRTLIGGGTAFEEVFGMPYHRFLETDLIAREAVRRADTTAHRGDLSYLTALLDLRRFGTMADLGGGDGLFLTTLLTEYPHLTGTLVDRPGVAAVAADTARDAGVADRFCTRAADITRGVPAEQDAYLLKRVLREYPDEEALRILGAVREAMGDRPDSRLFVLERVVGAGRPDLAALVDIDMLLVTGGRERTAEQWLALFDRSGFDLVGAPARGVWVAHECRPRLG
jgi:multifunctional cyclase/dehydratase/O-methyltransferase